VVSGEAVVVWAGLGSSGSSPCRVVQSVLIISPQSSLEDSLVAVPSTHTSPSLFFWLGAKELYGIRVGSGGGAYSSVLLSSR
jgi:hypothetical protein